MVRSRSIIFIYYINLNQIEPAGGKIPDKEFQKKRSELFEKLRASDKLTKHLEEAIIDIYKSRGEHAIEVVKKGGVREEEGRWFVQGREDEYEVVRTYCTCYDYVINVVTGKAGVDMCYHVLAKTIVQLIRS